MIDPPRRLFFIHIGKTGGTFIRAALTDLCTRVELDVRVMGAHYATLTTALAEEDRQILFGIRHPLEIFVSGFHSRQRKGQPRYYSEWSDAEARAFAEFATPNELAESLNDTDGPRRAKAQKAMTDIEHVARALTFFLHDAATVKRHANLVFLVFEPADLDRDIELLYSLYGERAPREIMNDEASRHRNPSGLDNRLSEHAVQNLIGHYRNDIEIYDACRELRRLKLAELV